MSPIEIGVGAGIGVLILGGGFWIMKRALSKAMDTAFKEERERDLEQANQELEDRSRPLDSGSLVDRLRDARKERQ